MTFLAADRRHAVPLGREPDRARNPARDRRGAGGLGRDVGELPGEPVFAALHDDLTVAVEAKTNTRLGSRLNYEILRHLVADARRRAATSARWTRPLARSRSSSSTPTRTGATSAIWQTIKLYSGRYTAGYLLNAVDLQMTPDGIEAQAGRRAHLHQALPAHAWLLSLDDHRLLPAARLSDRLAAGEPAAASRRTC